MIQKSTLQFLSQLKKNNVKEWFDANRKTYENAREDYGNLITEVIKQVGKKDADIASLQLKDCIFRINRDVRFSKDKSPYKTNFGAFMARGGKKSIYAGYYFHMEPGGNSFVGGGLWMPMPENLKKVRQEVDYCFDEFLKIVKNKKFVSTYGALDNSPEYVLSRPPKGYDDENPAIEFLKMKSYVTTRRVTDAELASKDLTKLIVSSFEALQPMNAFINRALED
jgi:uncharacterized protein (TIGR02453 family)